MNIVVGGGLRWGRNKEGGGVGRSPEWEAVGGRR